MLILNNGVQKSGSSLVQGIVTKMVQPAYPSEKWRNGWRNPSVDANRLEDYVLSGEWKTSPYTLIKMHIAYSKKLDFLIAPRIRVIVSQRNIPDCVLSMFHHELRFNKVSGDDKNSWMMSEGVKFANHIIRYTNAWRQIKGVLFINYETLVTEPTGEVARIAAFLGKEFSDEEATEVARTTIVRLRADEAPRNGEHVRTGTISRASEEMEPKAYALFAELDRELLR